MAIYDKFAQHYDSFFAPLERLGLSQSRQEALSLLPVDARILELGCGTGANFEFYPPSQLALSTEFSIEMIKTARSKTTTNILVNADAQYLPFSESEFDAAFATLVFCSIPDPVLAFNEIKRVVKPGGKIILLDHVRPNGALGYVFDALNICTRSLFEDHFNRRTAKIAASCGIGNIEVKSKLFGIVNLIIGTV